MLIYQFAQVFILRAPFGGQGAGYSFIIPAAGAAGIILRSGILLFSDFYIYENQ